MESQLTAASGLKKECELSVVMPCLNEAETLAICIDKTSAFLKDNNICGEIIIADNGSADGSQALAKAHGARVVNVPVRGYGAALMAGINDAHGKFVIMGDADDSYDFTGLAPFITKLREGYDLVMGNRFKGGIKPGAMPFLHKYLGNPLFSKMGRLFFGSPIGDFYCGLRGFNKASIQSLNLQTTGMEFAIEMVVKSSLNKLNITEVPTILSPDGRSRPPHLRTWRDGWRTLRFLLIYSPRWLFLYPGATLMALGLMLMLWLIPAQRRVSGIAFDIHTMLYAAIAIILGLQMVAFALFSKLFAISARLLPEDGRVTAAMKVFSLERGLVLGALLSIVGIAGSVYAFIVWGRTSFGPLDPFLIMRITIPSLTFLAVGIQIVFASFFMSVLEIKHK